MERLNLPQYEIKVRVRDGKREILDVFRRKYVALTPEEWVRQHFTHFLVGHLGYPAALMANEVRLQVGEKSLRADTVLYGNDLQPRMIVEYKAPSVAITRKTFHQIAAYNLLLKVDYLVVSNGMEHYCCRMDYAAQTYQFLTELPRYEAL